MSAAPLLKGSDLPADVTDRRLPASPETDSATRGRKLLETHLDLIQRKLHQVSRHSGLPELEAEELCSWALFKLIEDDYRILGQWEGRSSFPTFLRVVLVNLMRDYRIRIWGKWRPSAAARRLGPEAVLLEKLLVRDGLPWDEARERLRLEHGISLSPEELDRLAAVLPRPQGRWRVGEEELLHVLIDGQVEIRIEEKERARTADHLSELLAPLLASLPAEERLLLRLCYFEDLSMAAIAPILGRPQAELYKVRDRCLKKLRRSLTEAGLGSGQIRELLGQLPGTLGFEALLGV